MRVHQLLIGVLPNLCCLLAVMITNVRCFLPINHVHFVTLLVDGWVLRRLILRAEDTEPERDNVVCDELIDFLAGFTT